MPNTDQRKPVDQPHRACPQLNAVVAAAEVSSLPTLMIDRLAPGTPILFANDAFLALSGFPGSTLIASPMDVLFGASLRSQAVGSLKAAIAKGAAGHWQISMCRSDNSTFPAMLYATPIRNPAAKVLYHTIHVLDLAAIVGSSADAAMIDPDTCELYDKAPGFIAMSSGPEHRFTYVNASYVNFVKRDDLIGMRVADALPEVVDQGVIALLDEVYRTGTPFSASDMPISIWDPDQQCAEECWIDVVYQPVRDESGAIIGLFCEGYDVTDLHETNEALAALQIQMIHISRVNAMGTIAATLAHELNQPLTAIANYLAGVRPGNAAPPDADRLAIALEGIGSASERAAAIINHLRQLTRQSKPIHEPFNLRDAVDECVVLTRCFCGLDITVENRIARDVIMTADRVMIQQVLINLLKNACEAMADTDCPLVSVCAVRDDRSITVSVADTGPGVSPAAIATMFSWTETAKDDGMGIGLSICRTIVELYRGRIWLEHSGPEGSEFCFRVPLPRRDKLPEDERGAQAT